jgi:hypothetical protein
MIKYSENRLLGRLPSDWNRGWKGYVYGHSNGRLPDDPWNGILTNGLAPLPFMDMDSIAILAAFLVMRR